MAMREPTAFETIALRDGTLINIRAIRPDDAPRLQALHARLSPESIFWRFLAHSKELTDEQARRLATVDYQKQMALVATIAPDGVERIIGVARYAAPPAGEQDVAEAAVVVEDQYQGRGVGTLLLERLAAYATRRGIRAFVALVHAENDRILRFIQKSGLPATMKHAEYAISEIHIRVELPENLKSGIP